VQVVAGLPEWPDSSAKADPLEANEKVLLRFPTKGSPLMKLFSLPVAIFGCLAVAFGSALAAGVLT